eukprot:scaffold57286_cov14-Tisochrysis_lutea.AAC.1
MASASQKEHDGRGQACMRALRGGKGVFYKQATLTCHRHACTPWTFVYKVYFPLISCLFEHEKAGSGGANP